MTKLKLPEHILEEYGSGRAYKAKKRVELRAVEKSFADLWFGGAWMPPAANEKMTGILAALREIKLEISANRWGR